MYTHMHTHQIRVPEEHVQSQATRRTESGHPLLQAPHALAPLSISPAGKGLRPENAKKETLIKEI